MEVPVADVADDRRDEPRGIDLGPRLGDAVREHGDRDAHVGHVPARARAERERRLVCSVPRLPQSPPLVLVRRPGELAGAELLRNGGHLVGLLDHSGRAPVELEEESVRHRDSRSRIDG